VRAYIGLAYARGLIGANKYDAKVNIYCFLHVFLLFSLFLKCFCSKKSRQNIFFSLLLNNRQDTVVTSYLFTILVPMGTPFLWADIHGYNGAQQVPVPGSKYKVCYLLPA
jgi:hypothetical protein